MFPYLKAHSACCARTGRPITIPPGCFRSTPFSGPSTTLATKPQNYHGLAYALKAAGKQCGIHKPVTLHTLRHSWATHLLEVGVNLRLIQALAGTQISAHNRPLHPSDPQSSGVSRGIHQSADGGSDMVEIADIFRQYGPAYRAKYGERMPPSHLKAMAAIEACRTETLGGHVYCCPECDETVYSYHSCRNRHCPKCQNDAAQEWLEKQQDFLLPVPYFMVTFTLPAPLKALARSPSETHLQPALSHLRRSLATTNPRPSLCGRQNWHGRNFCRPGRGT